MQPFFINCLGVGQIGCGLRCADVGVVRSREGPEEGLALAKYRNAKCKVGMVGSAVERAVVQVGVAILDVIKKPGDWLGRQFKGGHVNWQRFLHRNQPVIISQNPA